MRAVGKIRIVGGIWRGRKIDVPASADLRPTADRAREGLFNRLLHGFAERGFRLQNATVADVFAGTGAMGFEALSRGAASVTFLERDAAAAAGIEATIERFDANDRARVLRADALAPPPARQPFDLLVLDPPFDQDVASATLTHLKARGWIRAGSLIVVESERDRPDPVAAGVELLDSRTYGRIKFAFLVGV